jgi:uncharacterized phage protein (TIGR01671 family)
MRNLKFRFWDKTNKRMNKRFAIDSWGDLIDRGKGFKYIHGNKAKNIIVMQSTGLKDKNGKDIFEGDVVECSTGRLHEVAWDDFRPGWGLSGIDYEYEWTGTEEVIGNVYENPELINL